MFIESRIPVPASFWLYPLPSFLLTINTAFVIFAIFAFNHQNLLRKMSMLLYVTINYKQSMHIMHFYYICDSCDWCSLLLFTVYLSVWKRGVLALWQTMTVLVFLFVLHTQLILFGRIPFLPIHWNKWVPSDVSNGEIANSVSPVTIGNNTLFIPHTKVNIQTKNAFKLSLKSMFSPARIHMPSPDFVPALDAELGFMLWMKATKISIIHLFLVLFFTLGLGKILRCMKYLYTTSSKVFINPHITSIFKLYSIKILLLTPWWIGWKASLVVRCADHASGGAAGDVWGVTIWRQAQSRFPHLMRSGPRRDAIRRAYAEKVDRELQTAIQIKKMLDACASRVRGCCARIGRFFCGVNAHTVHKVVNYPHRHAIRAREQSRGEVEDGGQMIDEDTEPIPLPVPVANRHQKDKSQQTAVEGSVSGYKNLHCDEPPATTQPSSSIEVVTADDIAKKKQKKKHNKSHKWAFYNWEMRRGKIIESFSYSVDGSSTSLILNGMD